MVVVSMSNSSGSSISDDVLELLLESSGDGGNRSSLGGDLKCEKATRSSSEMSVFTSEMLLETYDEEPAYTSDDVNGSFQMDFTPSWSCSDIDSSPVFVSSQLPSNSNHDGIHDSSTRGKKASEVKEASATKASVVADAYSSMPTNDSLNTTNDNDCQKAKLVSKEDHCTTIAEAKKGNGDDHDKASQEKAMFSILDKSFASLSTSPLLPIPGDDLGKKKVVIKGVQLCFASLAVAFDSCNSTNNVVWSSLGAVVDNSHHETPTRQRPTAVPCEILFLFWEVLAGIDSTELSSDELKTLKECLANAKEGGASLSEVAFHVLISLGIIEMLDDMPFFLGQQEQPIPCVRITHESSECYARQLSTTLFPGNRGNSDTVAVRGPEERWNDVLVDTIRRSQSPSSSMSHRSSLSTIDWFGLLHLPHHMTRAKKQQKDVLLNLLMDDDFIQRRLSAIGIQKCVELHIIDCKIWYRSCREEQSHHTNGSSSPPLSSSSPKTLNEEHSASFFKVLDCLSTCVKQERESCEKMDDAYPEKERMLEEIGDAYHTLGTIWGHMLSPRDNACPVLSGDLANRALEMEKEHFLTALKYKNLYLGNNVESIAGTMLALGSAYKDRNDYYNAMKCFNDAKEMYRSKLGESNLNFAKASFLSGCVYCESRDYGKAMDCLEDSLRVQRAILGDKHQDVADTLNSMGRVLSEMGDKEEAMKHFQAALWIKEAELGKDSVEVSDLFEDIGNLFYSQGKGLHKAQEYYERALESRKYHLGKDHELVGQAIHKLTMVHKKLGDDKRAYEYLKEAVRIKSLSCTSTPVELIDMYDELIALIAKRKGPNEEEVAKYLQATSTYYEKSGSIAKAFQCLLEALRIRKLASNDIQSASILMKIGIMYAKRGQFAEALSSFQEALKLRQSSLGNSHIEIANTLHNIGNTLVKLDSMEHALESYEEVLRIRVSMLGSNHVTVGKTLHNMGNIYEKLGDLQKSSEFYESALKIRREQLPEHQSLELAFTLSNLANVYLKAANDGSHSSQRNNDLILSYLKEALGIRKKKLGEEHELVGDCLFMLGEAYVNKGDLHGALQYFEESKTIYEGKIGKCHLNVGKVYFSIASVYDTMADYTNAISCFESSIAIKKLHLGHDHMDVGVALFSLGSVHTRNGNEEEMLSHYKEALRIMKLHGYKNDPRIGIILNDVGVVQAKHGHVSIALKCLAEALKVRKSLPSNEVAPEDVADTLCNLGNLYLEQGDVASALRVFLEAQEIYDRTGGSQSLDAANTLCQIAECHRINGDHQMCIDCHERVLEIRILHLGVDDLDVGHTIFCIGISRQQVGEPDKAKECYEEALRIRRLVLGSESPDVAEILLQEASVLCNDSPQDALKCYKEACSIYRSSTKEVDETLAKSLTDQAYLLESMNEIGGALEAFTEALDLQRQLLVGGEDTEIIAELLLNIGSCHLSRGDYKLAMNAFEESLNVQRTLPDDNNLMVAKILDYIGRAYSEQEQLDDALLCFDEALQLRKEVLKETTDLVVAESLDNVAGMHEAMGDFTSAITCYREALEIRKRNLEDDDILVGDTLFKIGTVFSESGKYDEAMKLYRRALVIREGALGESSIEVAQTLHNMGSVHALRKMYTEALGCWKRALSIYKDRGLSSDSDEMVNCTLNNIAMAEKLLLELDPSTGLM